MAIRWSGCLTQGLKMPIPVVTQRHFDLLPKTCDSTFLGRRDAALLWLAPRDLSSHRWGGDGMP
jgi:hypothetical protein